MVKGDEITSNEKKRAAALENLGAKILFLVKFLIGKTNVHKQIHEVAGILKRDFDTFVHLDGKLKASTAQKVSTAVASTQTLPARKSSVSERSSKRKPDGSPQHDLKSQQLSKKPKQVAKTCVQDVTNMLESTKKI